MTTPSNSPTAADAELIERLFKANVGSNNVPLIEEAIERLRALTAAPVVANASPEGWIPISERAPTNEDATKLGLVLVRKGGEVRAWEHENIGPAWTHWMKMPAPPAEPTAEELLAAEDDAAFEAHWKLNASERPSIHEAIAWKSALRYERARQSARGGGKGAV